ncbi:hypothetical protein CDD83_2629 [Cordyceps sp. RAO-2017]|nr:hypothetical protein CDD83_2629 [Cordyceps sp. RAO-2017]
MSSSPASAAGTAVPWAHGSLAAAFVIELCMCTQAQCLHLGPHLSGSSDDPPSEIRNGLGPDNVSPTSWHSPGTTTAATTATANKSPRLIGRGRLENRPSIHTDARRGEPQTRQGAVAAKRIGSHQRTLLPSPRFKTSSPANRTLPSAHGSAPSRYRAWGPGEMDGWWERGRGKAETCQVRTRREVGKREGLTQFMPSRARRQTPDPRPMLSRFTRRGLCRARPWLRRLGDDGWVASGGGRERDMTREREGRVGMPSFQSPSSDDVGLPMCDSPQTVSHGTTTLAASDHGLASDRARQGPSGGIHVDDEADRASPPPFFPPPSVWRHQRGKPAVDISVPKPLACPSAVARGRVRDDDGGGGASDEASARTPGTGAHEARRARRRMTAGDASHVVVSSSCHPGLLLLTSPS